MKRFIQFYCILTTGLLLSACSNKPFTLQSYADKYFNNKESNETIQSHRDIKPDNRTVSGNQTDDKTTNSTINSGTGADVAWSSTYKRDSEREEKGALQKKLDAWMTEEWNPTFQGDKDQSEKDKEASEHFTIQHYVDKAEKYFKKKEEERKGQPQEPAHYEKISKLPVIGN